MMMMRSADAGSDHHLVVAVIKMKLLALKKPSSSRKKYCRYRFKDQTLRKEFFNALTNRYDAELCTTIWWMRRSRSLISSKSGVRSRKCTHPPVTKPFGKAKRERKAWMSENTWRLIEERRVLKAKLEAAKTRQQKLATMERYNEKNHEAKRSCRRDKRWRIDEIA